MQKGRKTADGSISALPSPGVANMGGGVVCSSRLLSAVPGSTGDPEKENEKKRSRPPRDFHGSMNTLGPPLRVPFCERAVRRGVGYRRRPRGLVVQSVKGGVQFYGPSAQSSLDPFQLPHRCSDSRR